MGARRSGLYESPHDPSHSWRHEVSWVAQAPPLEYHRKRQPTIGMYRLDRTRQESVHRSRDRAAFLANPLGCRSCLVDSAALELHEHGNGTDGTGNGTDTTRKKRHRYPVPFLVTSCRFAAPPI